MKYLTHTILILLALALTACNSLEPTKTLTQSSQEQSKPEPTLPVNSTQIPQKHEPPKDFTVSNDLTEILANDSTYLPVGYQTGEIFMPSSEAEDTQRICVSIDQIGTGWIGEICFVEDRRENEDIQTRLSNYEHGEESQFLPDAPTIGEGSRVYTGLDEALGETYYNGEFVSANWIGQFHFALPESDNPLLKIAQLSNSVIDHVRESSQVILTDTLDQSPEESSEPLPKAETQPELTPEPVPTVHLGIPEPINTEMLIEESDGLYTVEIPSEGFDHNHPPMPTYIWHINGVDTAHHNDVLAGIASIVVEFDMPKTVAAGDFDYFGYDRGFFIGLHRLEPISKVPTSLYVYDRETLINEMFEGREPDWETFDTVLDEEELLMYPELMVDLSHYVEQAAADRYIARIPYAQFSGATRDLTLQFLPGTTFGNLDIYIDGDGRFSPEMLDDLMLASTPPYVHDFTETLMQWSDWPDITMYGTDDLYQQVDESALNLTNEIKQEANPGWMVGTRMTIVNPDGSVNMPVALYDLGDYAHEISGEYAVIPDGLLTLLTNMNHSGEFSNSERRAVINFIFSNMVNEETGLIQGIWDVESEKLVAKDRPSATLPILFALYQMRNLNFNLEHEIVNMERLHQMQDDVIEHEIIEVDGTFYYAPYGISEDGVMTLHLVDFTAPAFFRELVGRTAEHELYHREQGTKLLDAYANSFDLILEQQEKNPTHLPADTLQVTFNEDGTYDLTANGLFSANNPFLLIESVAYNESFDNYAYKTTFRMDEEFQQKYRDISGENGFVDAKTWWANYDDMARFASNYRDALRIINARYQLFYHIYNFARSQPTDTVYAPLYDVDTGEMIPLLLDNSANPVEAAAPWYGFRERFGSFAHLNGWFNVVNFFHDEKMSEDTAFLFIAGQRLYLAFAMDGGNVDLKDKPQSYFVDFGLDTIGLDVETLFASMSYRWPGHLHNALHFGDAGTFAWRETAKEFMDRKLRELAVQREDFKIPARPDN